MHPDKSISPSTMVRARLNRGTKNSHEMDWNSCALCQLYNLTRPIWLLASLILVTLSHPQCQRMIISKNSWFKSHSSVSNYPKPLAKPRFPAKNKNSHYLNVTTSTALYNQIRDHSVNLWNFLRPKRFLSDLILIRHTSPDPLTMVMRESSFRQSHASISASHVSLNFCKQCSGCRSAGRLESETGLHYSGKTETIIGHFWTLKSHPHWVGRTRSRESKLLVDRKGRASSIAPFSLF